LETGENLQFLKLWSLWNINIQGVALLVVVGEAKRRRAEAIDGLRREETRRVWMPYLNSGFVVMGNRGG
jgi:hypothetical protein